MKKFIYILLEITVDAFRNIACFCKRNLISFANILTIAFPYLMYFIGQSVALDRNQVAAGGELFIPIVFAVIIHYIRTFANKLGKGLTIPLPEKRFTQVDDDGEVSIENSRIQELLLYTADLEDWLEKKDLL